VVGDGLSAVRLPVPAAIVLVGFACASNRPSVHVAPSNESIVTRTEMAYDGKGEDIYVVNHSSDPIVVTGVRLVVCENTVQPCGDIRLHVTVPAGEQVNVVAVRVRFPELPWHTSYSFSWVRQ
jgi:hypothetical protein